MFNKDFFPTEASTIEIMVEGLQIADKVFLEPSAGKGNIVDYLKSRGAKDVIACENNEDLRKILFSKCKMIGTDFLNLTSDKISHIDCIIMNPPFSADEKHIIHAYNIAPPGCKIISLCNTGTIENQYNRSRQELGDLIDLHGTRQDLGEAFTESERYTRVKVSIVKLQKPGANYQSEFEGFFMEDDPKEEQANGLMSYNAVRDLVNRYVAAVKLFDEQMAVGLKMNNLLGSFYGEQLTFSCSEKDQPKLRADFKKDMQKAGWKYIFQKMNMQKHSTRGLADDINKFVEQQSSIPFTMRNIYKMLEIVIGTQSQRMDRAILEAFDHITKYHDDNRYNVPGWKTNSHYLVGKRFIFDYIADPSYDGKTYSMRYNSRDKLCDLEKALCFITGTNYDEIIPIDNQCSRVSFGEWHCSHFFKFKGFKKGTMHFEFKNLDLWAKFNQHVCRLKGYPLFEGKEQTAYQDRNTGRTKTAA